jgi:hypothetical protein
MKTRDTIWDTTQRLQGAVMPLCVYCDLPMRPVLADRLHPAKTLTQFACQSCGWEVMVPLE